MPIKTTTITLILTAGLSLTFSEPLSAQDVETLNVPSQTNTIRRVIRKVEPVTYWVDADKLSIRNNPIAGDIIGTLDLGRKVKAYSRFENWVRISAESKKESWVNTDYLTNEEISWANYSFSGRTTRRQSSRNSKILDVDIRKISIEGDSKARIYAARITEIANRNRTIVTKQSINSGSYFEKYLVSCDTTGTANGVQIVGEGHNYLAMEGDVRSANIAEAIPQSITADTPTAQGSIAKFACSNLPN